MKTHFHNMVVSFTSHLETPWSNTTRKKGVHSCGNSQNVFRSTFWVITTRMDGVHSCGIGHFHPIPSEGPFGSIPCGLSSFYPRVSLEKLYQNFFCGLLVANWDVISRHHFMHIAPFCGSYLSAHQPIMWGSLQSVAIQAHISEISPNSGRETSCTSCRWWDEIFVRSLNRGVTFLGGVHYTLWANYVSYLY